MMRSALTLRVQKSAILPVRPAVAPCLAGSMGLMLLRPRQGRQRADHPGIAPAQEGKPLRVPARPLVVEATLRVIHLVERPTRDPLRKSTVTPGMTRGAEDALRCAV